MPDPDTEPLFGTFRKSAISEDIVDSLLSLILERELRPGDKLPPERELAAMMRVSRPSLREALRALAIMNIVEIRQGDGTYITSLKPGLLMSHLGFVFGLTDASFLELFEARRILEPAIAALAAVRISDVEVENLEACMARTAEFVDDSETFVAADIEIHEMIAKAAHNTVLNQFLASISQLGKESRRRTVAIPGMSQKSLQDHAAIVDALKAHDPERARQAMLKHLLRIEAKLIHSGDTNPRKQRC